MPDSVITAVEAPLHCPLPEGWRRVRLRDVCVLNPRRPEIVRADDAMTSFIPMAAVIEDGADVIDIEQRPYSEVRKGYTYLAEGDVLFAKITPCMQNGKHAVARGLIDDIGFGSTEFHVLRPLAGVTAEWLQAFLRQPQLLENAEAHMSGAVGQQRLPASYLADLPIPLPPLAEQRRIAAILAERMTAVERARAAAEAQLAAAKALSAAELRAIFESDEAQAWPKVRLGDVLRLRKDIVHPYNNPSGPATFVGLEHIAPGTGQRIGSDDIEMSELTGRKPRFFSGDIVYGYLRPYLNKVWIADFDGLCSVDQYVYSVDAARANAEFIGWFMRSPTYLERAPINVSPGQLPRIRTEEVAAVEINLPSLTEQQRVAAQLDARMADIAQLRATLEAQLDAINALPAALLRQAFNGEM